MRILLYTPSYTVDRDPTSLRATKLMAELGVRGWRCDIVSSPVFHQGDAALRAELRDLHAAGPYLRVWETHPGFIGSVRYRLHRRAPAESPAFVDSPVRGKRAGIRAAAYRLMRRWHRGYDEIFARIGDPDWIPLAVLQGMRLLRRHKYQVIFASASSYFGSHIAAAILSTIVRLPLVVDYVDPWGPPRPYGQKPLDTASEGYVLRRAAGVVVANWRDRDRLRFCHRFLQTRDVDVITQGYDLQADAGDVRPACSPDFVLLYTGSFYSGVQSPVELLKAVKAAQSLGVSIRMRRVGRPLSEIDRQVLRESALDEVMEDCGQVSHSEAVTLQRTASVLLALGTTSRYQMPGKVIEYIAARRPILCLSQGHADLAAAFVEEHGLGLVAANRADAILNALTRLHLLWREGRLESIYRPQDVEAYSWRAGADRLERILQDAIESRTPSRRRAGTGSRAFRVRGVDTELPAASRR